MNKNYSSKTLEDILYDAENHGIRHEVLELATKLNKDKTYDFFYSIIEAYTIIKSKKNGQ